MKTVPELITYTRIRHNNPAKFLPLNENEVVVVDWFGSCLHLYDLEKIEMVRSKCYPYLSITEIGQGSDDRIVVVAETADEYISMVIDKEFNVLDYSKMKEDGFPVLVENFETLICGDGCVFQRFAYEIGNGQVKWASSHPVKFGNFFVVPTYEDRAEGENAVFFLDRDLNIIKKVKFKETVKAVSSCGKKIAVLTESQLILWEADENLNIRELWSKEVKGKNRKVAFDNSCKHVAVDVQTDGMYFIYIFDSLGNLVSLTGVAEAENDNVFGLYWIGNRMFFGYDYNKITVFYVFETSSINCFD